MGDIYHFLNRNGKQEKKRKERGRNLWEQVYITIYHLLIYLKKKRRERERNLSKQVYITITLIICACSD